MMRRTWMLGLTLAALALSNVVGNTQEKQSAGDNPEYVSWAKFEPGTMVEYRSRTMTPGNTIEAWMATKLVSSTADKVVLEITTATVVMGKEFKSPGIKRDVPRVLPANPFVIAPDTAKKPDAAGAAAQAASEPETLEIAGMKVKTEKRTTTFKANGSETVSTLWRSTEIPGGLVKMESKCTGTSDVSTSMVQVKMTKP